MNSRRIFSSLGPVAALVLAIGVTVPTSTAPQRTTEPTVSYNRDIRPLLADRCFHCHGPDAEDRKAKLRLDRADGEQGAYRTRRGLSAIKPGDPEQSALWQRITTDEPRRAMPPRGSHKEPFDDAERELIRKWIEQGADYEVHWAFTAPEASAPPAVTDEAFSDHEVDRFVRHRLERAGLQPGPLADRRTLIRRLSFDLTGLPPSPAEIRAFVADTAPGAYERLAERLLSSPHHGEHMARYWLDLVRFADTNGIHHDHFRDMSPFRDWVIRAFNDGMSYDRFVVDQIAGDLHPEPTTDQLIASGFNRLHMIIDRGTMLPEESFARNVIDRASAVGTAFMGLTFQCAVCHDHKYDPITQEDFYRLFAFFNNIDGTPETGGRGGAEFKRGLHQPYISFETAEQKKSLAGIDADLAGARGALSTARKAQKSAKEDDKKSLTAKVKEAEKRVRDLQGRRNRVLEGVRAAMVMKERKDVRPAHILIRGDYQKPGRQVTRGTPSWLPPMTTSGSTPSRMDLAKWLVSGDHPLTARVAVNRIWQQLFGVGLVKTSEDFGLQGEWPSHKNLLDALAVRFVRSGWNIKALLLHIVTSRTYQLASSAPTEAFSSDPENRLLARGSRFRMDAELVRDQVLATSGLLNRTLFGKSVKPPQPAGIWKAVTLPSSYPRTYTADTGDKILRRSLYTFWKRGMPPPQMTILDAPTRESCVARRERTNTPLQALLLMNEGEYLKAARHLAARLISESNDPAATLVTAYETITSKLPADDVTRSLLELLGALREAYGANEALADALCEGATIPPGASKAELSAWTMVVSAIYNLDVTKTRE